MKPNRLLANSGIASVGVKVEGGGANAAWAALKTQAPVVERFGLQGFGGRTAANENVLLNTIKARLYLAARVAMRVAQGKGL